MGQDILQLAGDWGEEEREKLFAAREHILVEAVTDGKNIPIEFLNDPMRVIAALSLAQEGYIEIVSENPKVLGLTNTGQRFAKGVKALDC